jgi:hypothetical protein
MMATNQQPLSETPRGILGWTPARYGTEAEPEPINSWMSSTWWPKR